MFRPGVGRIVSAVVRMDAHHRFAIALAPAIITAITLRTRPFWLASLASYDVYALVSLVLLWLTVALTPRVQIRRVARRQDVGTKLIFLLVVGATAAAMVAVALLLRSGSSKTAEDFTLHLLLALTTVVFSWLLVHGVFGLRYAHTFYGDSETGHETHAGGLLFPGPAKERPDYADFTYFSFVIGMTCQVSDVQVTSAKLRNLVLLHGLLSFGFNTVVLALTINIVAGLW